MSKQIRIAHWLWTGALPSSLTMRYRVCMLLAVAVLVGPVALQAQSVGLPAPRLLTTMPMGGQAGTQVEVVMQ